MLKTLRQRLAAGAAIAAMLAHSVAASPQINPAEQLAPAGATIGQVLSYDGSKWAPSTPPMPQPTYALHDTFTGSVANLTGRTPDLVGTGTWLATGSDAANYQAGGGKLQDVGGSNVAYGVYHTGCTGAPVEIGAIIKTSSSANSQPTIASLLNETLYGIVPGAMIHPFVQISSGVLTATPTVWDTAARPGGTTINPGAFLQQAGSVPVSFSGIGASTLEEYQVFLNGGEVVTRISDVATGVAELQNSGFDPLIPQVDGPDVFFELPSDGSYYTEVWAKCAAVFNTQAVAGFPGGLNFTPIGANGQSPSGDFGWLHVGLGQPRADAGIFDVEYNNSSSSAPSVSSTGDANFIVRSRNAGNTARLTLLNGGGCDAHLIEDGGFATGLYGCNASKAAWSAAANDGDVTFGDTILLTNLTASLPACSNSSKEVVSCPSNTFTNAMLAQAGANTVKANVTSSTANDTDASLTDCHAATSAVNYTAGTGFGCNTALNAATLGGATMAAPGAIGGTTPAQITATTVGANTQLNINGHLLCSAAAPTIASGFSSSGSSISGNNGTCAFTVTIGTTPGSTGVLTLPLASNGWACQLSDRTTHSTAVSQTVQTASTTTSATFIQYSDVMAATAWVSGDVLVGSCLAL